MTGRSEALAQIVALAQQHGISASDITHALHPEEEGGKPKSSIAMRLFSYLGGIFVFSGIAAYIGMFWDDMNSPMRVIITLGSGFVLFIMGITNARTKPTSRTVTPLLLLAALLQPTGMFVAIDEYFNSGSDPRYACLFVFGVMLLQQAFTFGSLKHGVLLFMSILFGALLFGTVFDLLDVDEEWIFMILGLSLLLIAYALRSTPFEAITGFWFLVGGMSFLWSAFDILEGTPVELLYLAVTCFMVYVSVLARSTALLAVSVLAMIGYIGYFTAEHFVDSVGWPVALILLGLLFFAISNGAMRIRNKYLKAP